MYFGSIATRIQQKKGYRKIKIKEKIEEIWRNTWGDAV